MSEVKENLQEKWSTYQEYISRKPEFIEKVSKIFLNRLNSKPEFDDLTETQKNLGAEFLAHFWLGVETVYGRFGRKHETYNMAFAKKADDPDMKTIGLSPSMESFVIMLDWFKDLIKTSMTPDVVVEFKEAGGIVANIQPKDYFELAGVEESAHFIFYKEKKRLGKEGGVESTDPAAYHTREAEERALVWQIAYTRRSICLNIMNHLRLF